MKMTLKLMFNSLSILRTSISSMTSLSTPTMYYQILLISTQCMVLWRLRTWESKSLLITIIALITAKGFSVDSSERIMYSFRRLCTRDQIQFPVLLQMLIFLKFIALKQALIEKSTPILDLTTPSMILMSSK